MIEKLNNCEISQEQKEGKAGTAPADLFPEEPLSKSSLTSQGYLPPSRDVQNASSPDLETPAD